jgi:hypothetical protein
MAVRVEEASKNLDIDLRGRHLQQRRGKDLGKRLPAKMELYREPRRRWRG